MTKWTLILLALTTALTGCGRKTASESTYLLPWSDAEGRYSLKEVTISTLQSPYEARGTAADVYVRPNFSDHGFSGSVATPRLIRSGHVYVPMDAESSMALSVYAQFERIHSFTTSLGFSHQVAWPRRVAIELGLAVDTGSERNNAHYFTELDVIGIVPYTLDGVPFAVNQGIVAHEHFHAHFQQQVIAPLQEIIGAPIVSALENIFFIGVSPNLNSSRGEPDAKFLNDIVVRGWNEGLADLFAALYTGRADFFSSSMGKVAKVRALDDSLLPILPGADLQAAANGVGFERSRLVGLAYSQGTALARVLYRAAGSGVEAPLAFLQRVMARLVDIPQMAEIDYSSRVMDFDLILPVLLNGFPMNKDTCADLKQTVTKATFMRSFSACLNP